MIAQRRRGPVVQAFAGALPFQNDSFDAVLGTRYRLRGVSKTTGHHGSLSSAELIAEAQTDGAGTTYRYPFVPLPVVRIQFGPPVG
jgi:hypothetical protein